MKLGYRPCQSEEDFWLPRMGATTAFVSGTIPAANALYQPVMGSDLDLVEQRVKNGKVRPGGVRK
jgi:hypothetical protein